MIANAIKEILPNVKVIYLEQNGAPRGAALKILQGGSLYFIKLPSQVYHKMLEFDVGFKMGGLESSYEFRDCIKPFEFELVIPKSIIENIGINQIYKVLSESKTLLPVDQYLHI